MLRQIQAGQFKAKCLKIMDHVNKTKKSVIITKRSHPVAKLVPFTEENVHLFGIMKGTVHVLGDITEPIDEEWDANL